MFETIESNSAAKTLVFEGNVFDITEACADGAAAVDDLFEACTQTGTL